MITIIVVSLLVLFAGLSNSIMDTLTFHFDTSWFKKWKNSWFDPEVSWLNKWKTEPKYHFQDSKQVIIFPQNKRVWYYLWLYKPTHVERFPFSSTILVFTTDGWHFFKWLMWTFIEVAVVLCLFHPVTFLRHWGFAIFAVLSLKVIRGIGFSSGFDFLWVVKKKRKDV